MRHAGRARRRTAALLLHRLPPSTAAAAASGSLGALALPDELGQSAPGKAAPAPPDGAASPPHHNQPHGSSSNAQHGVVPALHASAPDRPQPGSDSSSDGSSTAGTSSASANSSSAAAAAAASAAATAAAGSAAPARTLYPPAERSQIRDSWRQLMRWSKVFSKRQNETSRLEATNKVVVFGGGSFGTAMGVLLARKKENMQVSAGAMRMGCASPPWSS